MELAGRSFFFKVAKILLVVRVEGPTAWDESENDCISSQADLGFGT